jgi:ankyrin repeat protein
MLRKTREIANLSKADALRITLRILPSLPQPLQGAVEYISEREIEHGSEMLPWLHYHISLEVVTYLVQTGADINAERGWNNCTILHEAAYGGHLDVVKYLISLGANVNAQDKHGFTPLHSAALSGHNDHLSIVQFLVQSGADPNIRHKYGRTALDFAREYNKHEVAEWLQNHTT